MTHSNRTRFETVAHRGLLGAAALALSLLVVDAHAQPALVPVQGQLETASGMPLNAEEAQVTFRLYPDAIVGAPLHTEAVVVELNGGVFTHLLGSGDALDLGIFDGGDVWLSIQVEGEAELTPRLPVATTPYAAWAQRTTAVEWSGVTGVPPDVAAGGNFTGTNGVRVDPVSRAVSLDSTGCNAGAGWFWNGTAWTCTGPTESLTQGFGIVISAGVLRINQDEVQRRPSPNDCPFGIRSLGANGAVVCATSSNVDTSAYNRVCSVAGTVLRGFDAAGNPVCVTDANTNVFGQSCAGANEVLRGYTAAGVPICIVANLLDTNVFGQQCPVGTLLTGFSAVGAALCKTDNDVNTNVFGTSCASPLVLRGYNGSGNPLCVADIDTNTTYSASGGITLSGTQFRLVNREVQMTSCAWKSCSNGSECVCDGNRLARAWQDANFTDYVQCCIPGVSP